MKLNRIGWEQDSLWLEHNVSQKEITQFSHCDVVQIFGLSLFFPACLCLFLSHWPPLCSTRSFNLNVSSDMILLTKLIAEIRECGSSFRVLFLCRHHVTITDKKQPKLWEKDPSCNKLGLFLKPVVAHPINQRSMSLCYRQDLLIEALRKKDSWECTSKLMPSSLSVFKLHEMLWSNFEIDATKKHCNEQVTFNSILTQKNKGMWPIFHLYEEIVFIAETKKKISTLAVSRSYDVPFITVILPTNASC